MSVSKNLRFLKEENKYTYRDISLQTNINLGTLNRIMHVDQNNLTLGTLRKLSNLFNVSLDDLVYKDLSKEITESST